MKRKFDTTGLDQFLNSLETAVHDAAERGLVRAAKEFNQKTPGDTHVAIGKPKGRSAESPRAAGNKRSPAEMAEVARLIVALVKTTGAEGLGVENIGTKLNMLTKDLALPIRKLLGEKMLKSKGQKRATRYFAGPKA
jgi:hypothetical protein